jgi:hypothetical protein
MASNRSRDLKFLLLLICFHTCTIPKISSVAVGSTKYNSKESVSPVRQGDLIPRQKILNYALASAEVALSHIKENWIPLFDKNVVLDDPTGSHEFKGLYCS